MNIKVELIQNNVFAAFIYYIKPSKVGKKEVDSNLGAI